MILCDYSSPRSLHSSIPSSTSCPAQVALAGFMPLAVFLLAAIFTVVSTAMSLTRVHKLSGSSHSQDEKFGTWQMWQLGSGLVGLAVVPQVRYPAALPCRVSSSKIL